ncbi:hypothetical protein G3I19_05740, partial [Streptomyces sp. SID10853]|nr:hypothetical protein [Streptomyces sp. SID10853]
MSGGSVTGPPKAAAKDVEARPGHGTATVPDAMGRTGNSGPGPRPAQRDVRTVGTAVTVRRRPGGSLMAHAARGVAVGTAIRAAP